MAVIDLKSGPLSLRISTEGGIILGFWKDIDIGRVPLLRPAKSSDADALGSSCYPLVPFGNRVAGNSFEFDGRAYTLTPNTEWDPHYLHGEGWQAEWSVDERTPTSVEISFTCQGPSTPYRYRAMQTFTLEDDRLTLSLSVENMGERPLPFGLGWHPYFPLTPKTTLQAPAEHFWTEVEGWLPGERTAIPADLDFSEPAPLPERWVNNGYEGWSGEATIIWSERHTQLRLTADPIFRHAFVFVSDTAFDPSFERDYFCFEPMSHLANGHNLPDLGDLKVLAPGEKLAGSFTLEPRSL
ncbi:aldose 1-epimerase [Agrobacterium sp. InxBP2]|uniref:aldose 1-epimerase n=1 Tax=Agrobacterium sp. InxBP2 TaxID=2870329 RepID=UPI00249EA499|nr:aldose 1-epimerase [Agrobacterium sp. InxBP2]MCW8279660.1 aldose 1-epimerase [Agrobacterium sp. InxBP2]